MGIILDAGTLSPSYAAVHNGWTPGMWFGSSAYKKCSLASGASFTSMGYIANLGYARSYKEFLSFTPAHLLQYISQPLGYEIPHVFNSCVRDTRARRQRWVGSPSSPVAGCIATSLGRKHQNRFTCICQALGCELRNCFSKSASVVWRHLKLPPVSRLGNQLSTKG